MPDFIDLTDQRFSRWIVLSSAPKSKAGKAMWYCRCDCGREAIVVGANLQNNHSKGCRSCQVSRRSTKHGQARTRLYRIWTAMIRRCENPKAANYKDYGGRGIKVCPRWRNDFMSFRKWALENGYKKRLTIDRINNDKGYFPENCQFITKSENSLKAWRVDGAHNGRHQKVS